MRGHAPPLPYLTLCTANEDEFLDEQERGVCVYCTHTVEARDIRHWVSDRDGRTALCPMCSVDAVVHVIHLPMSKHNRYEKIVEWHNMGFGHWLLRYDRGRRAVVDAQTGYTHHRPPDHDDVWW